jgi:hypothetical protein
MNNIDIAKKATHMIVALYVAQVSRTEIAEHTEIDYDSIPLQVGCFVGGHLVANTTDRITHPAIDKVADWKKDRKIKNFFKKTETSITEA